MAGLDFTGLNEVLLERARELLPEFLPGGKVVGQEYVCGSINGEEGTSFKFNLKKGVWKDFADDSMKGGDLISLYAAVEGISQGEAAKQLAEKIGFRLLSNGHYNGAKHANGMVLKTRKTAETELDIGRPPVDTRPPQMKHKQYLEPVDSWCYRDADGDPLFYVARYNQDKGQKQFVPYSWSVKSKRWVQKGYPEPRPLYGLELLSDRPNSHIMIVEGEKTCEAARKIAGKAYIVMTWPNGAQSWKKADWTPIHGRKVLIWPDADEPGVKAADGIAELLHPYCSEIKVVRFKNPQELENASWDAADALAQEWDWNTFVEWAKPRAELYTPPTTVPAITPSAIIETQDNPGEPLVSVDLKFEKSKSPAMHSVIFANHLRDKLLFDEFYETWYQFKGTWGPITQGGVERILVDLLDQNYDFKYSVTWLTGILKFIRIRLGRSQIMSNMNVMDTWNTRRELLPMLNGVLNLDTKELIPHSPELMMNWMVPYEYDPSAECPTIRQFLKNLTQDDQSSEELALCYLWAVLHGCADIQKYLELIGKPGTGKSTYLRIASQLIGEQNTIITTMKQLSENRFETANFYGKRLAVITDADKWAGSIDTFKAITGQDPIRFEEKNKQQGKPFVFGGMIIVAANGPIQSNEQSTALVRRRLSIHLDRFFPDEKRDDRLEHKIRAELPGLLNWLISLDRQGVLSILKDVNAERKHSTMRALVETDAVAAWANERLIYSPGESVQVGVIKRENGQIKNNFDHAYPNFVSFLEESQNFSRVPLKVFSGRLLEVLHQCGFDTKKEKTSCYYIKNFTLRGQYDTSTAPLISDSGL